MRITTAPQGNTRIEATALDAWKWANRPGRVWPGSDLAHLERFALEVDSRGDLMDMEHSGDPDDGDILGAEVSAFIEYALWEARSQIDELLTILEERERPTTSVQEDRP